MKILLLDNYDSFTWNLFHYLEQVSDGEIHVKQNDEITVEEAGEYERIILSPGPGLPDEAGVTKEIIRKYFSSKPILGVCLGHQAIAEVFGAKLKNLAVVKHGVASRLVVIDKNEEMFSGVADDISIGHYHSWVVDKENFPADLNITAEDENGNIMALRHKQYNVCGVQFHPESVLTSSGLTILKNWVSYL
ncbi:MAG: aminodeoxychorismate/anthranilate synthase component II [Bacteroidia bacterium]|nr:aminodeoxychorismate/anthranilate synthase component II [Bacteroidia bacterium]